MSCLTKEEDRQGTYKMPLPKFSLVAHTSKCGAFYQSGAGIEKQVLQETFRKALSERRAV